MFSVVSICHFQEAVSAGGGMNHTNGTAPRPHPAVLVVGLGTPNFYRIHYLAIVCLLCSLFSVIAVLVVSVRSKRICSFYQSWSKCERFAVYMAVCDGFYSVVHLMDHTQVVITKSHVHPLELCEVYGFIIFMFVSAQMVLTSLIAINAFALMKFGKNVDLGFYDWKLLVVTYGLPFLECLVITLTGEMGPTGISCGVAGKFSFLCLSTIPVLAVMTINIVLYTLTWYQIRTETKRLSGQSLTRGKVGELRTTPSGTIGHKNDKLTRAARTMSLFVLVFIVQWGAAAVYGAWTMADDRVPLEIVFPVMTFSSLGGLLNGIVYLNMRKTKKWKISKTVISVITGQTTT